MKKYYLIAPLVSLLIFTVFYLRFYRSERDREQTRIVQLQNAKNAKLEAEIEARRQAVTEAVRVQAEYQKQREASEQQDRIRLESRQLALSVRDEALHEQQTLKKQIEVLRQQLVVEKIAMAQLTATRDAAQGEREFLTKIIAQSEANVRSLNELIVNFMPLVTVQSPVKISPSENPKN